MIGSGHLNYFYVKICTTRLVGRDLSHLNKFKCQDVSDQLGREERAWGRRPRPVDIGRRRQSRHHPPAGRIGRAGCGRSVGEHVEPIGLPERGVEGGQRQQGTRCEARRGWG